MSKLFRYFLWIFVDGRFFLELFDPIYINIVLNLLALLLLSHYFSLFPLLNFFKPNNNTLTLADRLIHLLIFSFLYFIQSRLQLIRQLTIFLFAIFLLFILILLSPDVTPLIPWRSLLHLTYFIMLVIIMKMIILYILLGFITDVICFFDLKSLFVVDDLW